MWTMWKRESKHLMNAKLIIAAGVVLVCVWAAQAVAQGQGAAQLTPEKREAAWTLEAKGVAKTAGLSAEATGKLVDAYKASRKSLQEAAEKAAPSGGGGGGREAFDARLKLAEEERGKFRKALEGFLSKEQVDKAIAPLGTYNRQWDRLVDALASFQVGDEKQDKGLALIATYVVDSDAALAKARAAQDMEGMRTAMQELKTKLDTAMADVLTPEQLTKWKEATAPRGGRRG
ncbi:MAG: hypothetical protein HY706_11895 [Candidatus Hydrogenedentes bacterium]|nr:hypothetical protein [Candidatus Hydrogenedentota bacterium]